MYKVFICGISNQNKVEKKKELLSRDSRLYPIVELNRLQHLEKTHKN
jgi:hypothetical protein